MQRPSPSMTASSACSSTAAASLAVAFRDGELVRLSHGHRQFGHHSPRRQARPALLLPPQEAQSSLSAAESVVSWSSDCCSLELSRCLLCWLGRRRPLDVFSSAAEGKPCFLFMIFMLFLQLNHIIFIPTPLSPNASQPSLSSPAAMASLVGMSSPAAMASSASSSTAAGGSAVTVLAAKGGGDVRSGTVRR